ncbi:sce7725 family protein [Nocardioides sp.]|uniref:sce7725 family protein n=1 Tax=Nocardioides sp. TaxID=35761 RepID=UPI00271DD432|nr:sce7725 family protein [Nocardioides sp.]MDO9455229.1 sce7725 family protein [Nocardioides sp.]
METPLPYFPYLYARQAELRALDITAGRFGTPQQIWPILEPVVQPDKLRRTLTRLTTAGLGAYVIVNPALDKLSNAAAQTHWAATIHPQIAASAHLRPAFKEWPGTTVAEIQAFATAHGADPVAVVLATGKLNPTALAAALAGANVTVFATSANAHALATSIGPSIQVINNFNAQARNSDYNGAEWLANNHLGATASSVGFSDYTILPGEYSSGGGPVGAAAIHITFKETDDSFWVEHFVSDETDRNIGTFQTKLLEAVAHLNAQIAATPGRFTATPTIATYLTYLAGTSPTNPSGNKSLQISHHLHMVADYMGLP